MSFQFIDNGTANTPDSRRAIRSHVMKGRNLGRKIQGRGRKNAPPQTDEFFGDVHQPHEEERGIIEVAKDAAARQDGSKLLFPEIIAVDIATSSNPFAGSEFQYFSFPIQFTPSMRYMVYQFHSAVIDIIYPLAFCRPPDGIGAPWFEYMISDQAFLHSLLAMTATYLTLFHKPGSETLEATRHFSQAFRLINHKLSQPSTPSDSTLAVVASFAIHSNLIRDTPRGLIHFDGLQRILSLRPGGLASLGDSNRTLMHKICRTDIEMALREGTPTRFGHMRLTISSLLGQTRRPLVYPLKQICAPLRKFTEEIMALCRCPGRAKTVGLEYQDQMTRLWQGLLDFAPLRGERPQNPLDDLWHLSLLAFLATVAYPVECLRDIHTGLLYEMLRDRVERDVLMPMGADYSPLRFWVAFMYGLLVSDKPEICLGSHTRTLAGELDFKSWEDAKTSLQSFPWVGVAHGKPGKEFWDSMMSAA
ncbi:hypothetical protein BGZ61DRAFT_449721 [Ilyonectria robusta]|uniref:uncharacterized protein n=1 Tax=Ilyonectria robusta TaxID=1079257 RepID=UPI001E8E522C|nr:uncharacterized protein BGZ61DRAFT_449721 [Ilyonectria robusta]KAH8706319.1 hypothetical protein BGZ61DRAFT_449721 [Ilyonectria robusta]